MLYVHNLALKSVIVYSVNDKGLTYLLICNITNDIGIVIIFHIRSIFPHYGSIFIPFNGLVKTCVYYKSQHCNYETPIYIHELQIYTNTLWIDHLNES